MTVYTEGRHPGEFLLSEAAGQRSREVVTVVSGAGVIAPGTILGKITAGGKYQTRDVSAVDGSETAAAVALYGCDATSADAEITAIFRDAEVKADGLALTVNADEAAERASAATELAAAGIIVR